MFENLSNFFRKVFKKEGQKENNSGKEAKERLHLVLMQDRANVSADFLEMMKQEIIEVIKKYIDVDENSIDVRLTNQTNEDGTNGAPALYANIPIISIKEEQKNINNKEEKLDKENSKSEISAEKTESEVSEENTEKKEAKHMITEENAEQQSNEQKPVENVEDETEKIKDEKEKQEEDKKEEVVKEEQEEVSEESKE